MASRTAVGGRRIVSLALVSFASDEVQLSVAYGPFQANYTVILSSV